MIITQQYLALLLLACFMTVLAWILDAPFWYRDQPASSTRFLRRCSMIFLVILIVGLCFLDFPLTLTVLVVGSGLITLVDTLCFKRKRLALKREQPTLVAEAKSFFWVLLLVWIIRSFLVQPYRVPTGSLQPTVNPGDLILVNQYEYGLRFPVFNHKLLSVGEPKRGDIVLFYSPQNLGMILVKRVIGLPGDHIEYRNKTLYINGKEMSQKILGDTIDDEPAFGNLPEQHIPVSQREENLDGVIHPIFVQPDGDPQLGDFTVDIPPGQYFMMGDNRDNSDDSRIWGFLPEQNIIGKAFRVLLSWDAIHHRVRWERTWNTIP